LAKYRSTFTPLVRGSPTLKALAHKVRSFVNSSGLPARESADILWALANLRSAAPQLKDLLPLLIQNAEFTALDMNEQEVSNRLWACATLGMGEAELSGLVPLLIERTVDRADGFNAQEVFDVIWATATLRESTRFAKCATSTCRNCGGKVNTFHPTAPIKHNLGYSCHYRSATRAACMFTSISKNHGQQV